MAGGAPPPAETAVRHLSKDELAEADRIVRLAFGTFLGLPDPMRFMGDGDYVRTRYAADPSAALAAELDGRLVGTNFVTRWGSVGFFGPLAVLPELWNQGVARALLASTLEVFESWGVTHSGLFTFPQSPKHIALYQSVGFSARFLTPIMARHVAGSSAELSLYSEAPDKPATLGLARELTDELYPGLDLEREIEAAYAQGLGDTVLVHEGSDLAAFGVCHVGAGSEAGSGLCYVKFGATRPGKDAAGNFARLLDACEAYAASREATSIHAGVNLARRNAYEIAAEKGYRPIFVGVAMHHPDEGAYHHPGAYAIDDWR